VQVAKLAATETELAASEPVRLHGHVGPARNLAFDPSGDALRHMEIIDGWRAASSFAFADSASAPTAAEQRERWQSEIASRQRLSYGALMNDGTRSGRITSCVDNNVIV
jgi:hypothetical protein